MTFNSPVRRKLAFSILIFGLLSLAPVAIPTAAVARDNSQAAPIQTGSMGIQGNVTHDPDKPLISSRSWYGTSFTVSDTHNIRSNFYDGSNVGIEFTAACKTPGTLTVLLKRNSTIVGSTVVSNNGFSKSTWTNVGPGYFSFSVTSNTGKAVRCTGVAMYSW